MKSLRLDNLHYGYHKKELIIKGISADFKPNACNVLLGLNGSGKTTLIRLLAGLKKPDNGFVYLGNDNMQEIGYLQRSKEISYVEQSYNTGDDHFVEDYLSFGLMNTLSWYESPSKEEKERVKAAAEKFKITNLLNKKMNEISGGQKQIITICRAYIQNTEIIILDEPTSALDVKNQFLILNLLKELLVKENKTIILSTHNPNHALYLGAEVLLIHEGELIEQGRCEDIIKIEKLKKIYGENIKYSADIQGYKEITIG